MTLEAARPGSRAAWTCFAGICLFALLLRLPIAAIPLERDEGEYAYIAQRWMQGDIPYRDAFNQKLPASFAIYAIIERLFGTSPSAIHWGAQVYTLGTLAALFLLGRRLATPAAGLAAAAFGAFMTADASVLGNAANTELFMLLPLTAAMLALCHAVERDSLRWAFASGACAATAVLFKQVAVFNLVLVAVWVVWMARRRGASLALLLLGVACVVVPVIAYFVIHGAWSALLDATVVHNLHYERRLPLTAYPHALWQQSQPLLHAFWPILLLAAAQVAAVRPSHAGARGVTRRNTLLVLAWLGASFAGTASGGYFREHYFIQIIPALAVLAGMAVGGPGLRRCAPPLRIAIRGGLVATSIALGMLAHGWYFLPGNAAAKAVRLYGGNPVVASEAVGRFLATHAGQQDTVFVFGSEPQILYYAQRKSATRYIFMYPLTGPFTDARERQLAALQELTQQPPRFIVMVSVLASFAAEPDAPTDLPDAVLALVDRSYRLAALVPLTEDAAAPLLTGESAAAVWQDHAFSCCSLTVWEAAPWEAAPMEESSFRMRHDRRAGAAARTQCLHKLAIA